MTLKEQIMKLQTYKMYEGEDTVYVERDDVLKALEQQPNRCDSCTHSEEQDGSNCYECVKGMADNFETQPTDADCISREEAIRVAEQEPKIGHWEYVQYDSNPNIGNWHCSECRTIIPHMPVETDRTPIYKWCPMCGANMEVEE